MSTTSYLLRAVSTPGKCASVGLPLGVHSTGKLLVAPNVVNPRGIMAR